MLMEVYYEKYPVKDGKNKKFLPYFVNCESVSNKNAIIRKLKKDGFLCVSDNDGYRHILVNLKLKRVATIHAPCFHSCVDKKVYSYKEFFKVIYPKKQKNKVENTYVEENKLNKK